jgi:hypothetical protein
MTTSATDRRPGETFADFRSRRRRELGLPAEPRSIDQLPPASNAERILMRLRLGLPVTPPPLRGIEVETLEEKRVRFRGRLGLDSGFSPADVRDFAAELRARRGEPFTESERRRRVLAQLPPSPLRQAAREAAIAAGATTEGGTPFTAPQQAETLPPRLLDESIEAYLFRIGSQPQRIPVDPTAAVRGAPSPLTLSVAPVPTLGLKDSVLSTIPFIGQRPSSRPDPIRDAVERRGELRFRPSPIQVPQVDILGGRVETTAPTIPSPLRGEGPLLPGQVRTQGIRSLLRVVEEPFDFVSEAGLSFATPVTTKIDPVTDRLGAIFTATNPAAIAKNIATTLARKGFEKATGISPGLPGIPNPLSVAKKLLRDAQDKMATPEGQARAEESRRLLREAFALRLSGDIEGTKKAALGVVENFRERSAIEQIVGSFISPDVLVPGSFAARQGGRQVLRQMTRASATGLPPPAIAAARAQPVTRPLVDTPAAVQRALPPGRTRAQVIAEADMLRGGIRVPPTAPRPIPLPGQAPVGALPPGRAPVTPGIRAAVPTTRPAGIPTPARAGREAIEVPDGLSDSVRADFGRFNALTPNEQISRLQIINDYEANFSGQFMGVDAELTLKEAVEAATRGEDPRKLRRTVRNERGAEVPEGNLLLKEGIWDKTDEFIRETNIIPGPNARTATGEVAQSLKEIDIAASRTAAGVVEKAPARAADVPITPVTREERRWLEREVEDPEWGFASVGDEPERVVWGVKSGDTLSTGSLDYVGYGEGPATLRGIHIGDADFWKVQLEKDYGLSQADARTIRIRAIEGDAYLPDRQYNVPPEFGEMGESQVLVTKRTQLEYGKDWVFEGETFAPTTAARAADVPITPTTRPAGIPLLGRAPIAARPFISRGGPRVGPTTPRPIPLPGQAPRAALAPGRSAEAISRAAFEANVRSVVGPTAPRPIPLPGGFGPAPRTGPPPTTPLIRPVYKAGPSGDPIPLHGPMVPHGASSTMTQEASEEALYWFAAYIKSPEAVRAWRLTQRFRSEVLAGREARLVERARELVEQGVPHGDAVTEAAKQLSGPLPRVMVDFSEVVTPEIEKALQARVYQVLGDEGLELTHTMTALTNALTGGAIPRKPGTAGGSAFSRLSRVFAPEIVSGLGTGRSLEDVIRLQSRGESMAMVPEGVSRATREFTAGILRPGFGMVPRAGRLIDEPALGGAAQRSLIEGVPAELRDLPPGSRSAAQRRAELQAFRTGLRPRPSGATEVTREFLGGVPERGGLGGANPPRLPDEPIDQYLSRIGQRRLLDEPIEFRDLPPELRSAAQRRAELQAFRTGLRPRPSEVTEGTRGFLGGIPERGGLGGANPPRFPDEPIEQYLSRIGQRRLIDEPITVKELPPDPLTEGQRMLDTQALRAATGGGGTPNAAELRRLAAASGDEGGALAVRQIANMDRTTRDIIVSGLREARWAPVDIANILRSNKASLDASHSLRQGLLIAFRDPYTWFRANARSLRAALPDSYAAERMALIEQDPFYQTFYVPLNKGTGRGDFLRPLDQASVEPWERAQEFMAMGDERYLTRFAQRLPWLNISARIHVVGINEMAWAHYKKIIRQLLKQEERIAAGEIKESGFNLMKEAQLAAEMLADMTGRGPALTQGPLSPIINAAAFSLRMQTGRFHTLVHLWSPSKTVRVEAWKNMLSAMGSITGFVLLGWANGMWDVEFDRNSADFMKIQIGGRTVLDPYGGYQQMFVLLHRLGTVATGGEAFTSSATGEVRDVTASDLLRDFVANKASPGADNAWKAFFGETLSGHPFDRSDWKAWISEHAPLAAADMIESAHAAGLITTTAISPFALQGVGVFTRDLPRWPEVDEYYRLGRKEREQYRNSHPENAAKLFIRGEITTLTSQIARAHMRRLIDKHGINEKDIRGLQIEEQRLPSPFNPLRP